MQRALDSKIQAKVRILLARKWVDLRPLTVGTTNGVVYLGGVLRLLGRSAREKDEEEGPGSWLQRLELEIRAIPDVNDVVFQFQELERAGKP